MPNLSPIGGFSLLIHLAINIISFCYRKIVSGSGLIFPERFINKEGDTAARRAVAYVLISCIMIAVASGTAFVVTFGLSPHNILNVSATLAKAPSLPTPTPLTQIEPASNEAAVWGSSNSLVDTLKLLGISDTSIDARAEIARSLGIVAEPQSYKGLSEQNVKLLSVIKEKFISSSY